MRRILSVLLLLSLLPISLSACSHFQRTTGSTASSTPPDSEPGTEPPPVSMGVSELFPQYRQSGVTLHAVGEIPEGTEVEITMAENLRSFSLLWQGKAAVAGWEDILPTVPEPPSLPPVGEPELVRCIGELGLRSATDYLLWTDLWRLTTYVLVKEGGGWKLLASLPCSAGDLSHPTPRGVYRVQYHSMYLGKEEHYLCKYALCFSGDYLYHSVLLTWNGRATLDGRLGERVSLGCVRHSLSDSQWLYDLIPDGTTVLIR